MARVFRSQKLDRCQEMRIPPEVAGRMDVVSKFYEKLNQSALDGHREVGNFLMRDHHWSDSWTDRDPGCGSSCHSPKCLMYVLGEQGLIVGSIYAIEYYAIPLSLKWLVLTFQG